MPPGEGSSFEKCTWAWFNRTTRVTSTARINARKKNNTQKLDLLSVVGVFDVSVLALGEDSSLRPKKAPCKAAHSNVILCKFKLDKMLSGHFGNLYGVSAAMLLQKLAEHFVPPAWLPAIMLL